jgi:hypothetical protein
MSFLPASDREYLESKVVAFEEVQDGGQKAIILKAVQLPSGRFDAPVADILIILPPAYPDVAPDMFHLMPWVRLVPAGKYPNAADQSVMFKGQNWQRWSRHNSEWRPGIDGIWTMLKRVEDALARAA